MALGLSQAAIRRAIAAGDLAATRHGPTWHITGDDVVAVRLTGQVDLANLRRIQTILDIAQGRARALESDLGGLRLRPSVEDIAALAADGYVGEVLAELREACQAEASGAGDADEGVAAEALGILAGLLPGRRA